MKSSVWAALLVGLGGFLGSVFRYGLAGLVQRQLPLASFPYGTLTVNFLGCLAIGYLVALDESRQLFGPDVRLLVFIGMLGGFTTFSTFGYETLAMLRDQEFIRASANVALHVVVVLPAVWLGSVLAGAG